MMPRRRLPCPVMLLIALEVLAIAVALWAAIFAVGAALVGL